MMNGGIISKYIQWLYWKTVYLFLPRPKETKPFVLMISRTLFRGPCKCGEDFIMTIDGFNHWCYFCGRIAFDHALMQPIEWWTPSYTEERESRLGDE